MTTLASPSTQPATRSSASYQWAHGEDVEPRGEGGEPWLFNSDFIPIEVPEDAIGYRVRFIAPRSRGIGEPLLDESTGRPLLVDPHAGAEAFYEAVGYRPGRYRLRAVDRRYRPIEDAEVAVVVVTEKMAAAWRGQCAPVASPAPASPAAVPSDLMAQAFLRMLDIIDRGQGQAIGSMTDLVRAAGEAGVVTKTAAMAAASAGTPLIVPAAITGAASLVSANANAGPERPRDAAPFAGSSLVKPAADADRDESLTALEKILDATMTIAKPLMEHVAPAVGYKASKWAGMSDEVAQTAANVAREAIRTGFAESDAVEASAAPTRERAVAPAAVRSGMELMAHAMTIQNRLEPAERSWVGQLLARHPHLLQELRDVVAGLTVEQGVATVRHLWAVQGALIDSERLLFEHATGQPGGFRALLDLLGGYSVEEAVAVVRDLARRRFGGAAANASAA
jgi:hypothetical protein